MGVQYNARYSIFLIYPFFERINMSKQVSTRTQVKKEKLNVILRNEADGEHAMFYIDEHKQLICFTFRDSHNIATYDYYLNNTVPAVDGVRLDAFKEKLRRHYDGVELNFMRRLTR